MTGPKSKRRFDTVFLFSSTMSPSNFKGIPNNYKFANMDILPEIVRRQASVTQYNKQLQKKRKKGLSTDPYIRSSIVLVLDDLLATGDLRNNKLLNAVALNGRHVNAEDPEPRNEMCTFIISQTVTGIDPKIRRNTDVSLCNRISSRNDRKVFIESGMCCDSSRYGLQEAYHCFDNCTTCKPYAMCALLNYKGNKREHDDFVRVFVADTPTKKPPRLFGTDEDHRTELPSVDITA